MQHRRAWGNSNISLNSRVLEHGWSHASKTAPAKLTRPLLHPAGDRAPKSTPGGLGLAKTSGKLEFVLPGKPDCAGAEGGGPRVESGHAFQGSANWERVWQPRPPGPFTSPAGAFIPRLDLQRSRRLGAGEVEDELFMCSVAPRTKPATRGEAGEAPSEAPADFPAGPEHPRFLLSQRILGFRWINPRLSLPAVCGEREKRR